MAAKTPPPGFVDLVTAQNSPRYSNVSIIGVVADYLPPFRNAKGQFQVTFKLQDYSTQYSSECLKVRLFDKTLECLPQIKAVGDIILLRSAKVNEYAGQILITSNSTYSTQTSHLVFSGAIIPSPAFKLDYVSGNGRLPCQGSDGLRTILGPVEQDYIITLKSALNIQVRAVDVLPPVSVGPKGPSAPPAQYAQQVEINPAYGIYSRKFKLVQDLRHRVFSDVCVEVVKKFTNPDGACELYVTDYTENKEMFYYAPPGEKNDLVRDGDQFGYNGPPKREWPGPYGFMVLKVNLSDPHASWANENVSEGAWIALENVKIKLMPNNSRLEGDMWRDQHNPTKVQIKKLTTTWKMIKDLRLRKDEYWTTYRAKVDKALEAENATAQKMTKGQKKRARQLKLQHIAEQEAAAAVK
jgi:protection-of-telomeres protein 1